MGHHSLAYLNDFPRQLRRDARVVQEQRSLLLADARKDELHDAVVVHVVRRTVAGRREGDEERNVSGLALGETPQELIIDVDGAHSATSNEDLLDAAELDDAFEALRRERTQVDIV